MLKSEIIEHIQLKFDCERNQAKAMQIIIHSLIDH